MVLPVALESGHVLAGNTVRLTRRSRATRRVTRCTMWLAVALPVLLASPVSAPAAVRGCPDAVVYRGTDYDGSPLVYLASQIRRSSRVSCRRAVNMLRVTYGMGPLKPVHIVKPRVGRYTYWLRGGWRMSNGAGGASVWNVKYPGYNEIGQDSEFPMAVTAAVGVA